MGEYHKGIDDLLGFWEREYGTETAIKKCLELLETSKEFEADKIYLSNDLVISFGTGERNKTKVFLFRESSILHNDEVLLSKAEDRKKFTKDLDLTDPEKAEINQALMQMSLVKPQTQTSEAVTEEKLILSETLADGRHLEALSTGNLAIYTPETDSVEYAESVIDNGVCYRALNDKFAKKLLVEKVGVYETERNLIDEISAYIYRHYDMSEFNRKICAYYILLTYVTERYFVVPYLHPRGLPGEGKTRFGQTINSACYRPFAMASANVAPTFRFITKYNPSIFLDEFNPKGDDKKDVIDLLLNGYKRGQTIIRCRQNQPDEIDEFNGFGCKIVASYGKFGGDSDGDALERRCIDVLCRETKRKDIQFTDTGQIQRDAIALREKLLRFRFRNLNRDFAFETIQAENLLKEKVDENGDFKIKVAFMEKISPLLALIQDVDLQKELVDLLVNETATTKNLKQDGFVYEMAVAIHEILFDIQDGKAVIRNEYRFEFDEFGKRIVGINNNPTFKVPIEDGVLCDALFVPNILQRMNVAKLLHDRVKPQYFGKVLHNQLGLETDQDWQRCQNYQFKRGTRIIKINRSKMSEKFKDFNLPIPENFYIAPVLEKFNVANVANGLNSSKISGLSVATLNPKNEENDFNVANPNHYKTNGLEDLATLATLDLPKVPDNIKNNGLDATKRRIAEL